jgi:hypothetical protein
MIAICIILLIIALSLPRYASSDGNNPPAPAPAADPTAEKPTDSYWYYGPNGLARSWNKTDKDGAIQRLGRDTWIHWTWGNQKVIRRAAVIAGNLPVPVSVDPFRLLDSRKRSTRFRDLGLINEPNCRTNLDTRDTYGLYLDKYLGDKYGYYPAKYDLKTGNSESGYTGDSKKFEPAYWDSTRQVDTRHYGYPSGIIGLRLFKNPLFTKEAEAKWDVVEYFKNPGKMEPPYLVGFSCGFCHVAFNPNNPPADPENPKWENLAANIGNQYLREGEMFLGKGRIIFGDKNPDPMAPGDPYRASGLTEKDFLYHYAVTQQPGTSETSRFSYDFINNPNTMTPIFSIGSRPKFAETTPWGKKRPDVWHVLKDGSDSIGIEWALMRVPINIGCEGDYWIDRLFTPLSGKEQRPFRIAEVLAGLSEKTDRDAIKNSIGLDLDRVPKERLIELQKRYTSPYGHELFGQDWEEAWHRSGNLKEYLLTYGPSYLAKMDKNASEKDKTDAAAAVPAASNPQGANVFADNCASCHSTKRLKEPVPTKADELKAASRALVNDPNFLADNYLADEVRYPVTQIRTNMARALGTNAIDHDVWTEFSSQEYKAKARLAPVTPLQLDVPVFQDPALPQALRAPIRVEFDMPAGGRGYYRTPSLISMWATAPYLHNNSIGDYYVILPDKTKCFFPNDGRRIGKRNSDGTWVDYRIDCSVEGRLKMFEDGMDKLLYPEHRHTWIKRTSAESTLIPGLEDSVRQLIANVAHALLRKRLDQWLRDNQFVPGQIDEALATVDASIDRVLQDVIRDGQVSYNAGVAAAHVGARYHADRFFDLAFEAIKGSLQSKFHNRALPLDRLKLSLRREFLAQLDALQQEFQQAAMLKVPAGTPVNFFMNLNKGRAPDAVLANLRYRDNPRALAQALLEMSTCPDLVEDCGHRYGAELSDDDKKALIEFLKTF